ncbi:MAG: hypothetical protein ABI763_04525 [Bacteroidota bacterium]
MNSFVITPRSKKEYQFLIDLIHKLNLNTSELSKEEIEDAGLLFLMKQADRSKTVSRDTIMKKLKS